MIPMRRLQLLTPEAAAAFNGVPPVSDPMIFVGARCSRIADIHEFMAFRLWPLDHG